jgi:hypothetical protein
MCCWAQDGLRSIFTAPLTSSALSRPRRFWFASNAASLHQAFTVKYRRACVLITSFTSLSLGAIGSGKNSRPGRSDSAHLGLSSNHSGLTSAYTTSDWLCGSSRLNRASPQRLACYTRCKKIIQPESSHPMKSRKSGVGASSNQPQILRLTLPILLEAWIFHPVQLFLSIYLFHRLLQSSGKCS